MTNKFIQIQNFGGGTPFIEDQPLADLTAKAANALSELANNPLVTSIKAEMQGVNPAIEIRTTNGYKKTLVITD